MAEPDIGWRSVVADRRRLLITLGSCLISAACLYYVLHRISLGAMVDSLGAASYGWLVPSIVLTIGTMWLRGVRWHAIFADRTAVSSAQCFAASSVGLMFNNLLPSRAGDVVRVFALRTASGVSAVEIGTTVVVERVLDVFVLGLFGLVLWPFLPHERWIDALGAVCAVVVAVCVAAALVAGLVRGGARASLQRRLARIGRIGPERAERIAGALSAGAAVLADRRRLAWCVLLSAAVWGVAGLAALVLFPAFDLDAGTLAPWLLLVANSFALVVPSSPGTVGVYEASVQASLVAFGVAKATAVSLALVLHAVNFFPVIAVGAIAWWWLRREGGG